MSDTLACALCGRDPDTGECFCVRSRQWVEKCPDTPDRLPWDAERIASDGEDGEEDGDGEEDRECA